MAETLEVRGGDRTDAPFLPLAAPRLLHDARTPLTTPPSRLPPPPDHFAERRAGERETKDDGRSEATRAGRHRSARRHRARHPERGGGGDRGRGRAGPRGGAQAPRGARARQGGGGGQGEGGARVHLVHLSRSNDRTALDDATARAESRRARTVARRAEAAIARGIASAR
eukprot:31153-Pelagococcus_subviridis.AAC.1